MSGKGTERASTVYQEQGLGLRIGFGSRPAVLLIDMQNDFVDPDAPSTIHPMIVDAIAQQQRLLEAARAKGVPIFFTRGLVDPLRRTEGIWRLKMKAHADGKVQIDGTRGADIIDALKPHPEDVVINKRRPSAFFQTDIEVFLKGLGIDTILLGGTSTSGCVRATATDAFMRDYRVMMIRECCADRSPDVHENNLFDLNAKYVDVVTIDEVLEYLGKLQG